jgi:hypothetical protein
MAYIGQVPQVGNFVKLDDISGQFNANLSTFNTTVSGVAYTVTNAFASLVVADGNVLNPKVDFNFNNATISFATAPTSAWLGKFFVIAYGEVLNTGIPSDGVITNAKLAVGTVEYSALSTANKATILSNSLIFGN